MKNIIFIVVGLFLITSCKDIVEGINENPNSPTSAPYSNVLTGAEVGNIITQTGAPARMAGFFCNYYTGIQRQFKGFSDYSVTSSDFNTIWRSFFINTLRNAKVTEQEAAQEGVKGVTKGIPQVLEALTYGTAAALFEDIPFDEAGKIEIENPKFEKQMEAYTKTQHLLDSAIINLKTKTDRPPSESDIYFDGDPDSWIEVAYTLKARFYMHTKVYDKAYAAAQKGISTFEHSMYAPHGTAVDDANLNYQLFAVETRKADIIVSDFMAGLMNHDSANYRGNAKTNEIARFNYYFETTSIGLQLNTTNGFAEKEAPAPIVTYQENLLILAETGLRSQGFNTGLKGLNNFRAFMSTGGYMSNVSMVNLRYDDYTDTDFENGGIENLDGLSKEDALLREILEERYITFFGQIEGFNDMRRTRNESEVRIPVVPNKGNKLPQRFLYPQTEIDRNENTPKPVPGLYDVTEVNK